MDNPNPAALSAEEIKKKTDKRPKRGQRNLWRSDWIHYLDRHEVAVDPGLHISSKVTCEASSFEYLDIGRDVFDSEEVFDLIRNLTDPEHPLTLEQLAVVSPSLIEVDNKRSRVRVYFTPTIPHCSQATLIGLMIRAKLLRCLPCRFKLDIYITPGRHNTEDAINKQLNDKERVAAALENPSIRRAINRAISNNDIDDVTWWAVV